MHFAAANGEFCNAMGSAVYQDEEKPRDPSGDLDLPASAYQTVMPPLDHLESFPRPHDDDLRGDTKISINVLCKCGVFQWSTCDWRNCEPQFGACVAGNLIIGKPRPHTYYKRPGIAKRIAGFEDQ